MEEEYGKCKGCGSQGWLGEGLCVRCWDRVVDGKKDKAPGRDGRNRVFERRYLKEDVGTVSEVRVTKWMYDSIEARGSLWGEK